ncbi:retrovirus-related pol polyprotein from transposon TNT 1-94 [Tanacetum coccineum]
MTRLTSIMSSWPFYQLGLDILGPLPEGLDSEKYLEGQSVQIPPLFESDSFIYWKNRFETYVKSKDLDLWQVITNIDFQPIQQNLETKLDEVIPFEKQSGDLKKRLAKNNEAKMVIYNALPRKEYERIFRCNTAKEIWKTLLIIHQDESINSAFTRFNTIITSLKALDESYSSKNYVRKFLRALHPKWRANVKSIEESKDLMSLSLDELIGNLKVHEMIIKKDSEVVKAKVERKSLALKAKKESSDEECSTSGSEDEDYAMANGKSDRKCFRCGDPNHLIGECPKPPKDKNQRAFVEGSWSDSGEEDDEKVNNETCLVAQASSEVCSESSYFSDENSSIDDLVLDNEYDKLCKMSLKIITKNKRLKATRDSLEKEISILKEKVSTLEKNKGVDLECVKCHMLKIENEKLKEEALKLTKFEKSTHCLNEILNNQKTSGEKLGLGFNSFKASSSGTKEIKFVKDQKKASSDGDPINMGGPLNVQATPKANMGPPPGTTPGSGKSICLGVDLETDEWIKDSECRKHMTGNRKLFSSYKAYNGGNVIFSSNLRGNIIGKGQICDNKCRVTFSEHDSEITKDGKVIGRGIRKKGLYVMKLGNKPKDQICLATIDKNSTLWHRRLGHANMHLIQSLASKELVRNLPKLKFDQHFCDACKIGKQAHASHKAKNILSTTRCLELLYMDLFGPSPVWSYGGNRYTIVIVEDYSREFDNEVQFGEFCNANGITHNFSAPCTLQSNSMVKRKNRKLQEMSKTMLNEQSLPQKFWCNAELPKKESVMKSVRASGSETKVRHASRDDKNGKSERKCFRCGDPNHLIGECPKPPRDKNQRAFVRGSWSDSGEEDDEKIQDETCLVAQAPNKVCSESSYFSDENSSIDDLALDNEYDKLCKMSLMIITKNKRLKAIRNSLENELRELKDRLYTLEKNKGVDLDCAKCHTLKIENEKLKEEYTRLNKFEKSTHCLNEMLSNQKPSSDKLGLGFNSFEASSSGTKEIKFVKAQKKTCSDGGPIIIGGPLNDPAAPKINMGPPPVTPGSEKTMTFQKSILGPRPKHIIVKKVKVPVASDNEVKSIHEPIDKNRVGFLKLILRF